jgi:oligopeptide/dipeptide ABC transporter ATP-binding protein
MTAPARPAAVATSAPASAAPASAGQAAPERAATPSDAAAPALDVAHLSTTFATPRGEVHAVKDVSFTLPQGQTMVLLGESGSGKSVTVRSLLRLHGGTATRVGGTVRLAGEDITGASPARLERIRGARIALVPQDPTAALDPLRRVGSQLEEVLRWHRIVDGRRAARGRAHELLERVGLPDPERVARSYPHELSGGMRQRVVIALAVSCEPAVLLADEPTTALDVTVQAQILDLFAELQRDLGTALLLITHDVGVAADVGGQVGVMYAGRLVETGRTADVLATPGHPYTRGLLASLPAPGTPRGGLTVIPGRPPVPGESFPGCAFAPRCPVAVASCTDGDDPPLMAFGPPAPGPTAGAGAGAGPERAVACPVSSAAAAAPTRAEGSG